MNSFAKYTNLANRVKQIKPCMIMVTDSSNESYATEKIALRFETKNIPSESYLVFYNQGTMFNCYQELKKQRYLPCNFSVISQETQDIINESCKLIYTHQKMVSCICPLCEYLKLFRTPPSRD